VTVTPGLGSGGLSDTALITATSRASAGVSKAVQAVTHVRFTPGVALSPGIQRSATQGEVVTYTHTITNTGTGLDTYSLTASSSQGWPILFPPPASLTLAAGEASSFSVVLKVPQTAYSGTLDILTITARSQTFTTTVATAQDRTLVQGTPSFKLYLPVIYRNYPKDGVDLVVTGIEIGPLMDNGQAVITVTTQNIGNRPVAYGNNFYVDLYIFLEDPYMPPPLVAGQIYWGVQGHWYGPGETVQLTGVYTFPVSAEWVFYAQIDTDMTVVERDETNNVYGPLRRYLMPGAPTQELSPSAVLPQIPRPVPLTRPRPVPPLQP
jgi:urease beta subunit